jgi:hypothetical protein
LECFAIGTRAYTVLTQQCSEAHRGVSPMATLTANTNKGMGCAGATCSVARLIPLWTVQDRHCFYDAQTAAFSQACNARALRCKYRTGFSEYEYLIIHQPQTSCSCVVVCGRACSCLLAWLHACSGFAVAVGCLFECPRVTAVHCSCLLACLYMSSLSLPRGVDHVRRRVHTRWLD